MGLNGYWRAIWTAAWAMPRLRRKVCNAGLCCNAQLTAALSVSGGLGGGKHPSGCAPTDKTHTARPSKLAIANVKATREPYRRGGFIIPHSVNAGEQADGVK